MLKALCKSTNEYRVETKEDADSLHQELDKMTQDNGWTLSAWAETYRTKKSGGEIIEEWYVCKYTIVFNDSKAPETFGGDIEYHFNQIEIKEKTPWEV